MDSGGFLPANPWRSITIRQARPADMNDRAAVEAAFFGRY